MVSNPKDQELLDFLGEFFEEAYQDEIEAFFENWPEQQSLVIDHEAVNNFDADLGRDLIQAPGKLREYFEEAVEIVAESRSVPCDASASDVTIRYVNLDNQRAVGSYRPDDLGTAMTVVGQLEQVSDVNPVLVEGVYTCQRCGTQTTCVQGRRDDRVTEPHECHGCERQGPFNLSYEESTYEDNQLVRVTTPPEDGADGTSKLTAVVRGELAGEFTGDIGTRAAVTGVLKVSDADPNSIEYPYSLHAEHIELLNGTGEDDVSEDELKVLTESDTPIEDLTDSILPGIHADEKYELIKEALVLQLVGSPKVTSEGSHLRGDWHMMLLGDPGTAKSELIDEAHILAPRSQLVGDRVTAAGLTASATEDDFAGSQWSIKAGSLVRANDGLCAIDEIDKISDEAVQALHNPMERQRVTASLADKQVSLPAYTAILTVGNPKYGRFDEFEPIPEQIDLQPTLLSRFDLIFLLEDKNEVEHDRQVATTISEDILGTLEKEATGSTKRDSTERNISENVIRAYISRARTLVPTVEDEAVQQRAIEAYGELREGSDSAADTAVSVTPRKCAAILRLAASSARARMSETIEMEDMERAIKLIRESMKDVGVDPETGEFDADIVETGTSMNQQTRMKTLTELIERLDEGEGAKITDINSELQWAVERIGKILEKLKQEGDIYEPKTNHYRTT